MERKEKTKRKYGRERSEGKGRDASDFWKLATMSVTSINAIKVTAARTD